MNLLITVVPLPEVSSTWKCARRQACRRRRRSGSRAEGPAELPPARTHSCKGQAPGHSGQQREQGGLGSPRKPQAGAESIRLGGGSFATCTHATRTLVEEAGESDRKRRPGVAPARLASAAHGHLPGFHRVISEKRLMLHLAAHPRNPEQGR